MPSPEVSPPGEKQTPKPANPRARRRVTTPTQPGVYPCTEPDCDRVFKWRSSLHHHRTTHARAAGGSQPSAPKASPQRRRRRRSGAAAGAAAGDEAAAPATTTSPASENGPASVPALPAAGGVKKPSAAKGRGGNRRKGKAGIAAAASLAGTSASESGRVEKAAGGPKSNRKSSRPGQQLEGAQETPQEHQPDQQAHLMFLRTNQGVQPNHLPLNLPSRYPPVDSVPSVASAASSASAARTPLEPVTPGAPHMPLVSAAPAVQISTKSSTSNAAAAAVAAAAAPASAPASATGRDIWSMFDQQRQQYQPQQMPTGQAENSRWWRRAGVDGVASPCTSGDLALAPGYSLAKQPANDTHSLPNPSLSVSHQARLSNQLSHQQLLPLHQSQLTHQNRYPQYQNSYQRDPRDEEDPTRGDGGPLVEAAPWDDVGSLASGETVAGGGNVGDGDDGNLDILAGLLEHSTGDVYQQYNSDTVTSFVL